MRSTYSACTALGSWSKGALSPRIFREVSLLLCGWEFGFFFLASAAESNDESRCIGGTRSVHYLRFRPFPTNLSMKVQSRIDMCDRTW